MSNSETSAAYRETLRSYGELIHTATALDYPQTRNACRLLEYLCKKYDAPRIVFRSLTTLDSHNRDIFFYNCTLEFPAIRSLSPASASYLNQRTPGTICCPNIQSISDEVAQQLRGGFVAGGKLLAFPALASVSPAALQYLQGMRLFVPERIRQELDPPVETVQEHETRSHEMSECHLAKKSGWGWWLVIVVGVCAGFASFAVAGQGNTDSTLLAGY